jgi:hypothetical protein
MHKYLLVAFTFAHKTLPYVTTIFVADYFAFEQFLPASLPDDLGLV